MFSAILYLFIGAMFGWFFLPAPQFAKDLYAKIVSYIPFLSGTKTL